MRCSHYSKFRLVLCCGFVNTLQRLANVRRKVNRHVPTVLAKRDDSEVLLEPAVHQTQRTMLSLAATADRKKVLSGHPF